MKPYTRSIIELFDGKKRYLIPLYQRKYSWNVSPQLELLWEDIERAAHRITTDRTSLTPHFMGAIVIAQVKTFGKQVQAFEIIDGQQRLTTFQLLLCALRDIAAANNSKYADELKKYILNDGVMENYGTERLKLWPSLTDRRAFMLTIDATAELDPTTLVHDDDDGYVPKAVLAHAYFKQQIESHVKVNGDFDEHRLETLFEALKEGLAAVSIELEGGDDPQTIFETLNSRGVDLTPADLMRNFIFQRAKGMGQVDGSLVVDKLYEKHWLPLDRSFWKSPASRGRQSKQRIDWMLTDHLSMHLGDIVSVEVLFERYRRWILNQQPFSTVTAELESITSTALIEKRLFQQERSDPLGAFGRLADAFDVSTAMPLVLYLATTPEVADDLPRALAVLGSYIVRRDICGLTTKNYNRLFIGIIDKLRAHQGNKVEGLIETLSNRHSDIDRWPDDVEWQHAWMERDQYAGSRQSRLRYIFEAIEKAKRSALSEEIDIKSDLTVEHIMPQKWKVAWPISGFEHLEEDEINPEREARKMARSAAVNKLGNLTLLTHALNASVSNGPFSVKMPAVRAHASLAINRELTRFDSWDEETIAERGAALFQIARNLWIAPDREEGNFLISPTRVTFVPPQTGGLPPDGTACRFTYFGKEYSGVVIDGSLIVNGFDIKHKSFSAASKTVTKTSRNGWEDWYLQDAQGQWILANAWRNAS